MKHPWNFLETPLKLLEIFLKLPWNFLKTSLKHPWHSKSTTDFENTKEKKRVRTDERTNLVTPSLLELLIAAKNVGSKSQDKKYWPRNFCPNSKDFGLRKFLVQNVLKTFLNFLQTTLNTYWETPLRHLEAPCWHSKCTTNSKDTKRKKKGTNKQTDKQTNWVTPSLLELLIAAKNSVMLKISSQLICYV